MHKLPDEAVLVHFRNILEQVGAAISANTYDKITLANKPGRKTLERRFGSWSEAKALALGIEDASFNDKAHIALAEQNKALLGRIEKERNLTQSFVNNCLAAIAKMNVKPMPIPKKELKTEDLEAHAMRSDAHVGEFLNPADVQGLSNYNVESYKRRVHRWTEKMIRFREQDKQSLGLNKLVLHHLGDQVTGENIYKGQAFYLDLNLTEQLFTSVEVESNAVLTLAQVYPALEIYCIVGNHGRPGAYGANHRKTNFDYLFYRSLKQVLINQPNIKMFVSESPSMVVQHGNFIFLLNHGDAAKGWMGIPFYGLERMFRRLPNLYNMIVHYELVGHHHQPANIGDSKVLLNGSLVGGSDLSINRMGLANLPSQKLFYFDKKHGLNRETNLHLKDPVQLKADENGIFTEWV
jgi:hypothetical protein